MNILKYFDKELYIWAEKYGWKSKSMCRGMIKRIHLLFSLNEYFNNLICKNIKDVKDLLYYITIESLYL